MTDLKDTLAALGDAAAKEADDIAYYSGGSSHNASLVKFHQALETAYRSGQLVLVPSVEVVRLRDAAVAMVAALRDEDLETRVWSQFNQMLNALAAMKGEGRGDG